MAGQIRPHEHPSQFKIQNSKFKTQNSKFKIQNSFPSCMGRGDRAPTNPYSPFPIPYFLFPIPYSRYRPPPWIPLNYWSNA